MAPLSGNLRKERDNFIIMAENNTESKDNLYKEIGEKMYPLFFKT